jgi:hypothetical protein
VTNAKAAPYLLRMSWASNTVLLVALVLTLSGCGSDNGEAGSSTPASGPQPFEFTGYLFRVEGETKICDAILESYPPQCGGESYTVTGLDVTGVDLQEAQGVAWTDEPVTLKGVLEGGTLVVIGNPALRGGPPPPTVRGQPGSAPG